MIVKVRRGPGVGEVCSGLIGKVDVFELNGWVRTSEENGQTCKGLTLTLISKGSQSVL